MLRNIVHALQRMVTQRNSILVDIRNAYNNKNLELLNELSITWSKQVEKHVLDMHHITYNGLDVVLQMAEILSEALISSWVAHFNKNGIDAESSIFLKHATNIVGTFHVEHKMSPVIPWMTKDLGTSINADKQNLTNMEYIPLLIGLYTCYEKEYNKEPRLKWSMLEFIENYKTNMLLGEQINKKTSMFLYKDYLTGGIKPFKNLPYTDLIKPTNKDELIYLIRHDNYNEECISTPYLLELLINSDNIENQYKLLEFLDAALINETLLREEFMEATNVQRMDMLSASGLMPQQSTLYTTNPNQINIETAIDKLITSFDAKISNPYNVFRSMGVNVKDSIKYFNETIKMKIVPEVLPELFMSTGDFSCLTSVTGVS